MIRPAAWAGAVLAGLVLTVSVAAQPVAGPQPAFNGLIAQIKADMLQNPARAAEEAARAEIVASGMAGHDQQVVALATASWLRAEALSRTGAWGPASMAIGRAKSLLRHVPHSAQLAADVLLTSGSVHEGRTEVAGAFQNYQAAHQLFGRAGDKRKQAIALTMISNLYDHAHDYINALHYADEALETYPADPSLAQAIYNSRGFALQELGQFELANQAMNMALRYARQLRSPKAQATVLHNIAYHSLLANRLAAADAAIAAERALADEDPNDRRQLDGLAAQSALQHRRLDEAVSLIARTFAGIDLAKTDVSWHDAHQTAIAIYKAERRPELALAHLEALKRLDDDATKLATQASTALMAARFDSANQEAKIVQLRDAERLRQVREALQQARVERTLWLGAAGATAVVILLLLVGINTIRRSRNRVRLVAADLVVTNDALSKALAAKTEFLATTSHEIRTPLNGILGMAQVMLVDETLPAPARERLGVLHTAGLTMRGLVDDILDMAKVETGHLTLEQASFDLPAVLAQAARMWADQAQEKGLALVTDLAGCPGHVMGDAARVRQIACNLLSNALKFTASGSVTLAAAASAGGIAISVADTGIGIAPEKLDLIFESFRQADTSTTRRFGGTGLGLAICRSLARAMGGDVSVASRAGEGSTFTAVLPLPIVTAPAVVERAAESADTLLIVDRNPITRAMLRTVFGAHVEAVAVAGTMEEAAARLARGGVTRVLVDEGAVTGAGGIEALMDGAGGVPVSLLSARADEAEGARWRALGVAQVIGTPISGPALVAAVRQNDIDQGCYRASALVSEAA